MFIQLNINDFDRDFQKRAEEYCYMYQKNVLTKKIRVINISLVKLKKAWDNLVALSKLEKIILFIKMSQGNENEIRKLVKC